MWVPTTAKMAPGVQQYRSIPGHDQVECEDSYDDDKLETLSFTAEEHRASRNHRPQSSLRNTLQMIAYVGVFTLAIASTSCAIIQYRHLVKLSELVSSAESSSFDALATCDIATSRAVEAPKPNIWKNLEVKEAVSLREWLFEQKQGLNLTKTVEATHG
ncbi:hypothetical protein QFC22_003453 [Naganishia vaughanmartiniae]|uniref:Uncharacterized protein n=1 Tax=Naganishia vaughanmartiniae TaxID=1424756 RepID=A0ACC2X7I0_9TREE|nr:hypothetical protein QFC22_003453 [Naganishia vaughanmartiniae]